MELGSLAEIMGDPLPTGYEDLRDLLVIAARERCTEIALNDFTPPLMYTDCLSADVSLPYRINDTTDCTICVQSKVWGGSSEVVECPASIGGDTGSSVTTMTSGEGDTADGTTGRMFECDAWEPGAVIASTYYTSGRPEGWYHHVHAGLLDTLIEEQFLPALQCDDGRYIQRADGSRVFERIAAGDLLWELGIRNGHEDVRVRGYDFATADGRTPWYGFGSVEDSIVAFDALYGHSSFEIRVTDRAGSSAVDVDLHVFAQVLDCATPNGVACPTP